MIDITLAMQVLRSRYTELEQLSGQIVRGLDVHDGEPYAVRYFDLSDNVLSAAAHLREYQDRVLSSDYYSLEARSDLRWNHYLYFVASASQFSDSGFLAAKSAIEADRAYAKKHVVSDKALASAIRSPAFGEAPLEGLPADALSIWSGILDQHSLGFAVDESLPITAIVKQIADGVNQGLRRGPSAPDLDAAAFAAAHEFLKRLEISGFRPCPRQRMFDFGTVNLVSGVNGVGKTSLLEAIEYLFCRQTKRTDKPVQANTSVIGTWKTSGLKLETKQATSKPDLRSRHLAWYGKSELRTLTLDDSFGKFNFLDTDAAVHLTVDSSRERLGEDLFNLLLGAESSKALDRLERVARQLEDAAKGIDKDRGALDVRRSDALRRVAELSASPQESSERLRSLIAMLEGVSWRRLPRDAAGTASLGETLQAALVSVNILKATDVNLSRVVHQPWPEVTKARGVLAEIDEHAEAESGRLREEVKAKAEIQSLEQRRDALDALRPMLLANVQAQAKRRDDLRLKYSALSARIAAVAGLVDEIPTDAAKGDSRLTEVIARFEAEVETATGEAAAARSAVAALEATQTAVTNAQQQLRAAALSVLQHTGDPTHCPVCRTQFAGEVLAAHLDQLASTVVVAGTDRARSRVSAAHQRQAKQSAVVVALRALRDYVDDASLSVADALARVAASREELGILVTDHVEADRAVEEHQRLGWTATRVKQLSTEAKLADGQSTVEGVGAVRSEVEARLEVLIANAARLDAEGKTRREKLDEIAFSSGLSPGQSLEALRKSVSTRLRDLETAMKAAAEIDGQLDLGKVDDISRLEANLKQAHELMLALRLALEREREGSDALGLETKLVEDCVAEMAALQVRLKRVTSAHRVISQMVSDQSDKVIADQILKENAGAIASTFAKIHSPSEFDVSSDDGLRITRRTTGLAVELEEMSSGQRAAYALSLFLAMNERLQQGPRVILFDDPVSHVDDINTLSFLDHLRDIALTGRRQIFFATADAKLAGLFTRKFRFLGDEFKHFELSRETTE